MSVIATSCRKPVVKFPLLWSSETWQFAFQESNQASLSGIRSQNSEFRFEKQEFRFESQNLRMSIDSCELGIGSLEVRIEQDLKLKIENSRKFNFFRKTTQRLHWEREIRVRGDHAPTKGVIAEKIRFDEASVRKERKTLVFGWWAVDGEKKHLLGGQLSETETSKRGNMSEVLRRNPSNKTSEIRRTFVFRTSTPARAAVTSENKHSICDIFSKYFLLKHFAQFIYSPKIIYNALLCGAWHIAVSFVSLSTSHRCDK